MARGRLSPDRALEIRLSTIARRHAAQYSPRAEAVAELVDVADGRADLMAEAAGLLLGGYLARPESEQPMILTAVALLADAGADPRTVVSHADEARCQAVRNHHTTATTGGLPNGR